jgi:ABC-type amino acid transport substrate-binding protein
MNRPPQEVRQFKGCLLASLLLLLSIFLASVAYGKTGDKDLISVNERAWLSQNQSRLVLAVETGYAPFVFLDAKGQQTGLAHDYMRLIEAKLGVQFNQKRFSSLDEIFKAVRSGEVHIVNAVTSTPERLKFLSMTDPYISVPNVIIVRKNHPGTVSEKALSGLKVSLVKSYAVTQYMTNHDSHFIPDIVADDLTALLNVSFGRSDAAVIDLATASYLISEKGIANLRVGSVVAYDNKSSLASTQNEPVLHGILQKGLNAITDAERQAIKQRWINLSEEQNILYDLTGWNTLGLVLAVAFLVVTIVVVKNRSFRLQIIPPLLVLAGGLALTYIVQQSALSIAYQAHQDVFSHQAREILLRIDQRLIAYMQILRGTKGLFYASESVERNEFHDYIGSQRLSENFPGVQGVGFSLVITPEEKARHIEAVRKAGFPNYLVVSSIKSNVNKR